MSRKPTSLVLGSLCVFLSLTSTLAAGWWGDVKKTFKGGVKTVWNVTKAPVHTVINTGKVVIGKSGPRSIYEPYRQIGKSAGDAVNSGGSLALSPKRYLYREVQKAVSKVGGKPGEFVFDVGTFVDRFHLELQQSGVNGAAQIMRQQNPLELMGAPLAAALRAARERHYANSEPIPPDVKNALRGAFSAATLDRARYAVGKVEITLPNFIGWGNDLMGNDHAVVVDDIIVFNRTPPAYSTGAFWWTHEMTHVDQYGRWGVETFAYKYIIDLGRSIESEADQKAAVVTGNSSHVGESSLAGTSVTGHVGHRDGHAVLEYYVAQCIFPQDPYPVHYLVTNTLKIVAVNAMNGAALHIGYATQPLLPNVAWSYQTTHLRYAVFPDGRICTADQLGRFFQVGHVIRLAP